MRAVFQLRPALPRYSVTWDSNVVLRYLSKLYPLARLTLQTLSKKLAMLIALISGRRHQALHMLHIHNMSVTPNRVSFTFGDLLKTSRPGMHAQEICLPAFPTDHSLCVVSTLNAYLERTRLLRGRESHLFISCVKPHARVSRNTISRWIRDIMVSAGIDIRIFHPHSTRAAAVSKASIPVDTILRTVGWSRESTFRKFYKKPIRTDDELALNVLRQSQ